MNDFLQLENLSFKYSGIGALPHNVLDNISLSLGKNECVAIVGQSGSGKTTLIQHFTGLLKPTDGRVLFQGRDIWGKRFPKNKLRKKIGLVFQFPETQLFEETVESDIAFGPKNMGISSSEIKGIVIDALESVELDPDIFRKRSPFRLSEGEKRRVAIAGVLAMQPEMLVFDEPTAGLDPKSVDRFIAIVQRLVSHGKAVTIVTHSMDFVAEVANRVVALSAGCLVFDGSPQDFFNNTEILNNTGLEPPSLLDALSDSKTTIPSVLRGVYSWQEFESQVKKSAHSWDL